MSAQLQQLVNRIERLETEKKTITADISEVYKEAKASGFDPKIMRKLIAKRKKPAAERQEEESLLDVYEVALGGVDNGPVTLTRKDGVKVTMERGVAHPVVESHIWKPIAATEEFDAVTGEIADRVHGGPNPHEHAGGVEGAPGTSPADPIALPHDPPEDPRVAVEAGALPVEQPSGNSFSEPLTAEGGRAPATPFDDDLTLPACLVRGGNALRPVMQAYASGA